MLLTWKEHRQKRKTVRKTEIGKEESPWKSPCNVRESQKEAARLLGISVNTLNRYENRITFPSINTVKKIEDVYGLSYNDIRFTKEREVTPV